LLGEQATNEEERAKARAIQVRLAKENSILIHLTHSSIMKDGINILFEKR